MKYLKILSFLAILSFGVLSFSADGAVLYKKCQSCHGQTGEKSALKVGAPVKGQKEVELYKKMKGYVDGSYGGAKKSIMQRNLKSYSDEDLKALAKFMAAF